MPPTYYDAGQFPPRWNHTELLRKNLYDMAGGPKARQGARIKKEGKADTYRIGGVDLPWDPELDLDKPKPSPLYPAFNIPKPKPLTEKEKAQVACHRQLRESIRNGPLYTVLGDNVRVGKSGRVAKAANPFEQPKYSDRYKKEKRMIPKLDTRPYVLEFFPKELWSTIDPTATESNGVISSDTKGKSLRIYGNGKEKEAEMEEDEVDVKEERGEDEEEVPDEEEVDDEFEDEEDGGDYNAEQYFDDGGDDAGDDYDDGGGEGGGAYYD